MDEYSLTELVEVVIWAIYEIKCIVWELVDIIHMEITGGVK